ncbi:hypothetical protein HMPREF1981_01305 [Bacteroides pyogenes F0041]|uniref:Uncharacterized protein n=1 Tax=Bacteroides pyogenes F0041 TaxID=1321819 RepID=U2DW16_9BACE|nr:hypothetical protein HMPREF1981_01305 [Bacteroides pyogenes F0041]
MCFLCISGKNTKIKEITMKKTWKLFGIFTLFMPLKSFVAPDYA